MAVVDQGTNSSKLLVFEVGPAKQDFGNLKLIFQDKEETRLGRGMEEGDQVSEEGLVKTMEALQRFKSEVERMKVERVEVIGTEVLRKAENAKDVVKKIKDKLGWEVRILSHEAEMELFWRGMTSDFEWKGGIAGIDIGGGSVQFMWGKREKLESYKLLKTGVLSLRERFIKGDPATEREFELIEEEIRKAIADLEVRFDGEAPLVHGSTSVIDFYQEAGVEMEKFNFSKSHPFKVDLDKTREFYWRTRLLDRKDRVKLFPSHPGFVDGAAIGLANVLLIAERTGLRYELPSNNNIMHGVVPLIYAGKLEEYLEGDEGEDF